MVPVAFCWALRVAITECRDPSQRTRTAGLRGIIAMELTQPHLWPESEGSAQPPVASAILVQGTVVGPICSQRHSPEAINRIAAFVQHLYPEPAPRMRHRRWLPRYVRQWWSLLNPSFVEQDRQISVIRRRGWAA